MADSEPFTLTGLTVVREVAARGSFTAAASALGYTQSAVSRQVAATERAAGAALFERGVRGVRPTQGGLVLLAHADHVLAQLESARRELGGLGETRRLRVGGFPTVVATLLPRAIARFRERHPDVEVELREGTTPVQLRRLGSGGADLAVVAALKGRRPEQPGVAVEPLVEGELLVALPRTHPLAPRAAVTPAQLAGVRWIAGSADPSDTLLGVWPALDPQPRPAYVARDWTARLALVAAGLGATTVPSLAASMVPAGVALVRVRGPRRETRPVFIATRAAMADSDDARAFADALHDVTAELVAEVPARA